MSLSLRSRYGLRLLLGLLLLAELGFIWYNSAQTAAASSEMSLSVTEQLASLLVPHYETLTEPEAQFTLSRLNTWVRELAHGAEFALLGATALAFALTFTALRRRPLRTALAVWGLCLVYALGDETHQLFVDGRGFQLLDIAMDGLGAAIGGGLTGLLYRGLCRKHCT